MWAVLGSRCSWPGFPWLPAQGWLGHWPACAWAGLCRISGGFVILRKDGMDGPIGLRLGRHSFFFSLGCMSCITCVTPPHHTADFAVCCLPNFQRISGWHVTWDKQTKKRKNRACTSHETELEDLEDFYGCNLPKNNKKSRKTAHIQLCTVELLFLFDITV